MPNCIFSQKQNLQVLKILYLDGNKILPNLSQSHLNSHVAYPGFPPENSNHT